MSESRATDPTTGTSHDKPSPEAAGKKGVAVRRELRGILCGVSATLSERLACSQLTVFFRIQYVALGSVSLVHIVREGEHTPSSSLVITAARVLANVRYP